jgi:hypothetical protein
MYAIRGMSPYICARSRLSVGLSEIGLGGVQQFPGVRATAV